MRFDFGINLNCFAAFEIEDGVLAVDVLGRCGERIDFGKPVVVGTVAIGFEFFCTAITHHIVLLYCPTCRSYA